MPNSRWARSESTMHLRSGWDWPQLVRIRASIVSVNPTSPAQTHQRTTCAVKITASGSAQLAASIRLFSLGQVDRDSQVRNSGLLASIEHFGDAIKRGGP